MASAKKNTVQELSNQELQAVVGGSTRPPIQFVKLDAPKWMYLEGSTPLSSITFAEDIGYETDGQ